MSSFPIDRAPPSMLPTPWGDKEKLQDALDQLTLPHVDRDDAEVLERVLAQQHTPFVTGNGDGNAIDPNDVEQGSNNSCAVLSTLMSVAQQDPAVIRDMIHDNGDGTYTVTFHERDPGSPTGWKEVQVTVSGPFNGPLANPSGDVNSQGQGEIWPAIIEKAYAQQYLSGDYSNGESAHTVMEHILGVDAESVAPATVPFDQMEAKLDNGEAVVARMPNRDDMSDEQLAIAEQYDIAGWHAYAVSDVIPAGSTYIDPDTGQEMTAQEDLVILDNPWNSSSGDVVMPFAQFQVVASHVFSAPTN